MHLQPPGHRRGLLALSNLEEPLSHPILPAIFWARATMAFRARRLALDNPITAIEVSLTPVKVKDNTMAPIENLC
jgi:hypothetical protein